MKKVILKNNVKLIYKHIDNNITSFTIGVKAGAIEENEEELGLAHIVEHMVFKGTKSKREDEINQLCDKLFGFNNAMTNYPYVVYYGTCLSEDFKEGFNLYSDIVLNPSFDNSYFKEEIDVICEELKQWSDDLDQYCEDRLLLNSFKKRRIKELIIGKEETIKKFTIDDVKKFYYDHYTPENIVISVASSLTFDEVYNTVNKIFGNFSRNNLSLKESNEYLYEKNIDKIFIEYKKDINSSKIQYIFPIDNLTEREVIILKIFNCYFGEGVSSVLYDEIRTKRGFVYDISSKVKNELGIKLFTITLGTSKEKIEGAIKIINEEIEKVKNIIGIFTKDKINSIIKSCKLKRMLALEKSIAVSFNMAVFEIMYGDYEKLFNEFNVENISEKEIIQVVNKVLINPSIEVITSN